MDNSFSIRFASNGEKVTLFLPNFFVLPLRRSIDHIGEPSIISGAWSFPVQPGFPRSVGAWGRRLAVQGRRGCRRRRRRWRCWCRRQQDGLRPRQRPVRLTVWDGPTGQGGRSPHPGLLSTFLGRTLACPNETYTSRSPHAWEIHFVLRARDFSSFYLVSIFFFSFFNPLTLDVPVGDFVC